MELPDKKYSDVVVCRVNVIIDPKARDQSFSVRYGVAEIRGTDRETMSIKFVLPKPWQVNFIAKRLGEILHFNRPFEIELGKCPTNVKENNEFKETVRDILYSINQKNFVIPEPPEPNFDQPFPPPGFEYNRSSLSGSPISSNVPLPSAQPARQEAVLQPVAQPISQSTPQLIPPGLLAPNMMNAQNPPPNAQQSYYKITSSPANNVQSVQAEYIDMGKVDVNRARRSIATMKIHIKEYGAHPNFSDMSTKNRSKICNYMRSTLAIPNMSMDEALYITSQI